MGLKDDILAKYVLATKPVDGLVGVHARALSGADWYDLLALEGGDRIALVILRGAVDATGARIFSDADDAKVRGLPREFTEPVSSAILALSGVGADGGKEPSPPSGGSPSA